ncbi:MAG: hypothetical protein ACR2NM_00230 [Bythopirellula sp.]
MLRGDAAQRAISAWHFGWEPAQQISGTSWLAPSLSRLLADPYGVVRYVAQRSLRTLPGFADLDYDFLADQDELNRQTQLALEHWRQHRPKTSDRPGQQVCLDQQGDVLETEVQRLLRQRNDRPVTIKE